MTNQEKEQKDNLFWPIVLSLTAIVISIIAISKVAIVSEEEIDLGSSYTWNIMTAGVTNSSTTVATSTATSILTRSTSRIWAIICNDDATNSVYVHFADASSSVAVQTGRKLTPGTCYEIGPDNLWIGRIWGIASGGQVVVTTVSK